MPEVKCRTCGYPMKEAGRSGLWIHDWSSLSRIEKIEVEYAHRDTNARLDDEDLPLESL